MKIVGVLFVAISALPAPAQQMESPAAKADALEAFLVIQEGEPPQDSFRVRETAAVAQARLAQLELLMNQETNQNFSENCQRFRDVTKNMSRDLRDGISTATQSVTPLTDEQFELENRIQIEIAAFLTIHYFFQNQSEGGYGVLDTSQRFSCPFRNRDEIVTTTAQTLTELAQYFRATFGRPGVAQAEARQRRLLQLAVADEKVENTKFWIYTGALTVATIALWEFAPVAVLAGVRGVWGFTPQFLTRPGAIFGMKVTAVTAEGFAFAYAEHLAADHPTAPKALLGSWHEYMDSFERLLESPIHAPQLELVLLSRVQAMVYGDVLPWLTTIAPTITREEQRFGSIPAAIRHYRDLEKGQR